VGEHPQASTGSIARRLAKAVVPAPARRWLRSVPYKVYVIRNYRLIQRAPIEAIRFMILGRELDNFTYEIANEGELARFLDEGVGIPTYDAAGYIAELQRDSDLKSAIETKLRGRSDRNRTMPYGRRLGWYAIVRARKPKLVVETGVHDGLGSAVLLRALERNADEGVDGILVSFDISEQAGWLVPDSLRSRHELKFGSAPGNFADAFKGRRVGLFIHDSDHRYEHEMAEFEAVVPMCAPNAVLITDNAFGAAFPDFCAQQGLTTHFFREIPRDHWYPGAGIGLAIRP
jgi:hypothetical protein